MYIFQNIFFTLNQSSQVFLLRHISLILLKCFFKYFLILILFSNSTSSERLILNFTLIFSFFNILFIMDNCTI